MNSCGILSNQWLVSQRTPPFLAGTVYREIAALRFAASTTIVAFLGLLQVGFLNFFCTNRWVLMRMRKSLCLPMSIRRKGRLFRLEAQSCKTISRRGSEAQSN